VKKRVSPINHGQQRLKTMPGPRP